MTVLSRWVMDDAGCDKDERGNSAHDNEST